jgi:predicted dehydrogenase
MPYPGFIQIAAHRRDRRVPVRRTSDHDYMTPLRAAIVGTGFMASVHTEALRRIGVTVLGVSGSSPARGQEQAQALGLPSAYGTYQDLVADDRIDVVHVCSPNHLHHEHALGALRAGKHVVCEKPLAMSSAEAAELCDVAHSSGLVHAVCFMQRFYPQCQEARRRVQSGEVGDVRLVNGTYLQDWLADESDWNWRLEPDLGGTLRAVGDIGSHWLDLAGFVTGRRIDAVMADLATAIPTRLRPLTASAQTFDGPVDGPSERTAIDTEDMAGILIRFDDGSRGVLTLSQVSPGRKNHLSLEVSGSKASLRWCAENPEELWVGRRDEPNQILLRGAVPGGQAATAGDYPAGHVQGFPDAFKAMYRAVYQAVAAGGPTATPNYPTFDDGVEQALIADAIAASAQNGTWTQIDRPSSPQRHPHP